MINKKTKQIIWMLSFVIAIVFTACSSNELVVQSPDKSVQIEISTDTAGLVQYQLHCNGEELIGESELSIFPDLPLRIIKTDIVLKDTTWNPVWGQHSTICDHYNELQLSIDIEGMSGMLLARVYNEGVAFRFVLDEGEKPAEATFKCEYVLHNENSYYFTKGETAPLGPLMFSEVSTFLQENKKKRNKIGLPLLVESPGQRFLALLESDLYASNGINTMQLETSETAGKMVSLNTVKLGNEKWTSPWRVIIFGETAGDLVVNTVPVNLATPNQLEDSDWIKPGKTLWDWRVHGYTTPDGKVYGIDDESYKRFIDFAAEKEIEYFLIDANWYTSVNDGQFEITKKLNLPSIATYANSKGVDLILYYDRHKGDFGDDKLYPYFQSMGMKGIKYGFKGNNADFSREAIQKSAESHLLIDFHDGPVPFTGIRRTYPNAITREYCHAQQDSRRAFTPESFIKMALINAITGPLDMNNGNFDITGINSGVREKGPREANTYFSTVVSEAARTLIIFSGLVCIPDAPEAYAAKADLFEFIQKMPVGKWDESRVLHSKMSEYITTARRYGKEWFIGSVYSQQGGSLDIELDFLEVATEYEITFYEDTEETHCKINPEAYQIRKGKVKKGDVITAKMAPGGGHCMWIRPLN